MDELHCPTIPKGIKKLYSPDTFYTNVITNYHVCLREQRGFSTPAILVIRNYSISFSTQSKLNLLVAKMDKLFAMCCLYEYQSPRSTPKIRRKQRVLESNFKISKSESQKQVKFRLLAKDDIGIVRQIYEQGHKDRIIPAFRIGIFRSSNILTMFVLCAVLYAMTGSLFVCVVAEILYSGAVLACFFKMFNDHISSSLKSDLADISQYYKTQESCRSCSDFADNGSSIWVAVKDNVVMGFVSFAHVNENTIELKRMGVSQKYWRNGVGISLCQFAVQFLQATNYCRIILETTEAHKPAGLSLQEI